MLTLSTKVLVVRHIAHTATPLNAKPHQRAYKTAAKCRAVTHILMTRPTIGALCAMRASANSSARTYSERSMTTVKTPCPLSILTPVSTWCKICFFLYCCEVLSSVRRIQMESRSYASSSSSYCKQQQQLLQAATAAIAYERWNRARMQAAASSSSVCNSAKTEICFLRCTSTEACICLLPTLVAEKRTFSY